MKNHGLTAVVSAGSCFTTSHPLRPLQTGNSRSNSEDQPRKLIQPSLIDTGSKFHDNARELPAWMLR
jgi:hypothetical protein